MKFRISPDAFFQVNTAAAEILYSTIKELATSHIQKPVIYGQFEADRDSAVITHFDILVCFFHSISRRYLLWHWNNWSLSRQGTYVHTCMHSLCTVYNYNGAVYDHR